MDLHYANELRHLADRATATLLLVADDVAARRPAPGKWSIKEIVGHLIDSAAVNHQRFVRAQGASDLVSPGYDQDAWVASQRYADAPWPDLVALFHNYNRHLAWLMASIPKEHRERLRQPHNLDQIAFRPVPAAQAVTLEYFMRDYVDHLQHHLRQIAILAKAATA